jgi:hypothetical protein
MPSASQQRPTASQTTKQKERKGTRAEPVIELDQEEEVQERTPARGVSAKAQARTAARGVTSKAQGAQRKEAHTACKHVIMNM